MPGGKNTNAGRKSGEAVIEAAFVARGLASVAYRDFRPSDYPGLSVALKRHPYQTLYGTPGYLDFVVVRAGLPVVTLEIKHQDGNGTCDEKLPFVFWNAHSRWPTAHGILVLSGEWWSHGRGLAAAVLIRERAAMAANAEHRLDVMDMTRATNWIAKTF